MNKARNRSYINLTARGLLILGAMLAFGIALAGANPSEPAFEGSEQAEAAWENALRIKSELGPEPTREELIRCARAYQRVYLLDPHYGASDDAVYEAARLYQELGSRFGEAGYSRSAAKLFRFLTTDYPASKHCSDARVRLAVLSDGPPEVGGSPSDAVKAETTAGAVAAAGGSEGPANQPGPMDSAPAKVQKVHHSSSDGSTRVSITFDRPIEFSQARLNNPERLFFDLANTEVTGELRNKVLEVEDDFLKQIRIAQNRPGVGRVVLDLAGKDECTVSAVESPFRIVVEIHPVGRKRAAVKSGETASPAPEKKAERPVVMGQSGEKGTQPSSPESKRAMASPERDSKPVLVSREPERAETPPPAPPQPQASGEPVISGNLPEIPLRTAAPPALPRTSSPTSRGDRTLTRMLGLKISRIVLDPGHGGHDKGTVGPGGYMEKDLVLKLAKDLKVLLERNLGAEVILTRDRDIFIDLEERSAIANENQADLFVSIHANYSSSNRTSGVETYFLDFARTEAEREVAARENATTAHTITDLQNLVRKITQADKLIESRELASLVQNNLFGGTRNLFPSLRNRGVKSAPFVVLINTKMPSVLVEVGFLSNPLIEKALRNDGNRRNLAEALLQGIEGYMKTLGTEVTQAQSGYNK